MKKRVLICLCLVLTLIFGMCIGATAAGGLEAISAYLAYNTSVKLDGETQLLYDGNGKQVYPINYQGTTYLPIRAISSLLGLDVNWDGATKTVLLGNPGKALNFIEDLKPYTYNDIGIHTTANPNPKEIAGKTYTTYIRGGINSTASYDLGGKYEELSFSLYTSSTLKGDKLVLFYGDNNELIYTAKVVSGDLPKVHTVNVSGTAQLTIKFQNVTNCYMFDAYIQ